MLKRKIMDQLIAWKNQDKKLCLLIKGARQVGKTFIIEQFAKENYKNYIYINFELTPSLKSIFDGDLDIHTLKLNLEANFPGKKLEKGKTLLFLDEIGACPNARVALKSFSMDGTIDVIASGSLLGLYYREISSYPVGYEKHLQLHPLDFEEFLWALGVSDDVIAAIKDNFKNQRPLTASLSNKLSEYFKLYTLIGGMPAAVNAYLKTESLNSVREVQKAIIEDYKGDVAKYAPPADKQKIIKTFDSIPVQLAKKNKKFMWSDIDINDTFAGERKYGPALAWLKDAGIINFCYNLSDPTSPLNAHIKLDSYKTYLHDTGLLLSMLEPDATKQILDGDDSVNEGGIVENVIAEELIAHNHDLTYFEKRGELEINFILNLDGKLTAIECKSGKHTQAKSLKSIMENYKTVTRYIKLEKDTAVQRDKNDIEYYPLFMGMCI